MEREKMAYEENMWFHQKRRREIFDSLIDVYNFSTTIIGNQNEEGNYLSIWSGDDHIYISDERVSLDDLHEVKIISKNNKNYLYVLEVDHKGRNVYQVEILENQMDNAKRIVDYLNNIMEAVERSKLLCNEEFSNWIKENGICKVNFYSDDKMLFKTFEEDTPYSRYNEEDFIYYSELKIKKGRIYWCFKNLFEFPLPEEETCELRLVDISKVKCAEMSINHNRNSKYHPNEIHVDLIFTYPIEK